MGAASVIAKDGSVADNMSFTKWQVEDVHDACWQTKARVELMDAQGVWAQIVYPNIMGFSGNRAMQIDAGLRLAATQIYNDALAQMQAESGHRLLGMALLPWWDIKEAVAELERCAAMGLRGVNMNPTPYMNGAPDLAEAHWNPLWEACVRHGLPVNFHIGSTDESLSWLGTAGWPSQTEAAKLSVAGQMLFLDQVKIMSNLIVSGVFDRFPGLKVVSVESGIGWIPFLLNHLEYSRADIHGFKLKLDLTPKEYFRRNIFACFWFENHNLEALIRDIGEDNVMFETDFPHPTCLYPDAYGYLRQALAGADPGLVRKVASTNAARLYNIPL
jgi:predicted TIM-barrel fold metal-dependent hydrolase